MMVTHGNCAKQKKQEERCLTTAAKEAQWQQIWTYVI